MSCNRNGSGRTETSSIPKASSGSSSIGPRGGFTSVTTPVNWTATFGVRHQSQVLSNLFPQTAYQYRLVASNADGQTFGKDRTFKTKVQPLGVTLVATPGSVAPGGLTVLSGQLTGTNNANRQVQLQSSAFPYTAGFATVGNTVLTDAAGNFTFNGLAVGVTTQFRVLMPNRPEVVSPIVIVGAAVQVKTDTKKVDRGRHSVTVRFSGSVTPATDGARVDIQKLRSGVWTTIAHTRAKHSSASKSRFKTRVKLYRSGQYRVVAESAKPELVAGAGRTIDITVRR